MSPDSVRGTDEGSGPEGAGPLGASGSTGGGGSPVPPALARFAELFAEGRYWDSHEALEDDWRATGSRFYHGLILLASAWVHVGRENVHGIDAQLRKALDALDGLPDAYLGVDLEAMRRAARRARRTVAEHRENPPRRWADLVPPPALELDRARLTGDEGELEAP